MNKYYIKLKALSSIHIGSGETYEPTNYVIDNGYLYEFDEMLFYKSLNEIEQKKLNLIIEDFFKIVSFYRNHIDNAKKIHFNKIAVDKEIETIYKSQFNKDGSFKKNQLYIEKTFKDVNSFLPIIPGSAIKGVFDTFLKIYSKPEVSSNEVRQKLKISDALCINSITQIGIAKRVHKNPNKKAQGIPIRLEVIKKGSEFIFTIDTELKKSYIVNKIREFFDNQFRSNKYFKISNDIFTLRVGRFCGYPFTAFKPKKDSKTYTAYNNEEFGWVECEFISKYKYDEYLNKHINLKKTLIAEKENRLNNIKESISKKEEEKRKAIEEKKKAEEQRKVEEEQKAREETEKLSKMSPLDRKIYELQKNNPNPNETIDIVLFNAIKTGKLDEFKCEALKRLKEEMMKLKKWVETSKKPQKDKKYKRTQEVIKMINEC